MHADDEVENPYLKFPPQEAWPSTDVVRPLTREEQILSSLRELPLADAKAIVFILAFARSQPFYIDVADTLAAANAVRHAIHDEQVRGRGPDGITPLLWVYYECFYEHSQAQARCAQIKATPHAWQRRLIDQFNSRWVNVEDVLVGYPFANACVGEDGVTKLTTLYAHLAD